MIIFRIDGSGEQLKQEDILAQHHIIAFYLIVESEMIMKVGIRFGNCRFQLRCNILCLCIHNAIPTN